MNRNFPSPFLAHLLRVSNPANLAGLDTRKGVCTPMVPGSCVKPTYPAGFTQGRVYADSIGELREANLFGWFYATGRCRTGVDNAGFHAIAPIGGVDEHPKVIRH